MLKWLKTNSFPLLLVGAFLAGSTVNGWFRDSVDYKSQSRTLDAMQVEQKRQGRIGAEWQRELRKFAKEREVIYREVKDVVDRPVYRNICIDDDGVRIANDAKNGAGSSPSGVVQEPARPKGN